MLLITKRMNARWLRKMREGDVRVMDGKKR